MMWKSLLSLLAALAALPPCGQERPARAEGTVPDGQVEIGSALGGSFVIARPLKKKYDDLISQTQALKARIASRTIDETSARARLARLREELRQTVDEIERTKKLVTGAKIHRQKTELDFELGPERLLVIRAARVRVVGWNEPQVRSVLEKIVLTVDGEGVEEDFAGLEISHRHGASPEVVGYTEEELIRRWRGEAAELTPLGERLVGEILEAHRPFEALQGKAVDLIEVTGLTSDQGNRQISLELRGDSGRSSWSEWRRHTSLTVFVPKVNTVGIRGGREGVTVESLDGSFAIVGEGDIDYTAHSKATGITGSVFAHNISLHTLDRIGGSVSLGRTAYQENAGNSHRGNSRTAFSGAPRPLKYTNIAGDLDLVLTRADLTVENVSGTVAIRNDFGDTTFIARKPLAGGAHRFVSEAGNMELTLPRASATGNAFAALTECGSVEIVNASRRLLEERSISSSTRPGPARRSWKGYTSQVHLFTLVDRINRALTGVKSDAGIDVINRGGRVRVEFTD